MPKRKRKDSKNRSTVRQRKQRPAGGPVIAIRSRDEFERYLDQPDPVVVDFWAPWCGPCQAMGPIFEQVAQQFAKEAGQQLASDGDQPPAPQRRQVRFLKVNTEALPEIAAALGIRSIPTLTVLLGDQVIDSNVGLTSPSALEKMARRALDKAEGRTLGQRIKRLFAA